MHHPVVELTRRPLLPLLGEGLAEPHKADASTNRMRRLADKGVTRRFMRASYNRRQRHHYHARIPARGEIGQEIGEKHKKRTAPLKHLGVRLRKR